MTPLIFLENHTLKPKIATLS